MSALLIGFLIVMASAALFGYALFGRRPVPQPATLGVGVRRVPTRRAENQPSTGHPGGTPGRGQIAVADVRDPRTDLDDRTHEIHLSAADVRPSVAIRLRAIALLALSVVGSAVLIGALFSIIFVGAVLIIS